MQNRPIFKLASSVVMTVALIPACRQPREPEGCAPPDCHMNPPGVEPPVTSSAASAVPVASVSAATETTPPLVASASSAATATVATAAASAIEPSVPPAPPGAQVRVSSDGRCYYQPAANCPPFDPKHPRTCNPPAPRQVACPDKR